MNPIQQRTAVRRVTWKKKASEGAEPLAKARLHPMKVVMCIWWNSRVIIHYELFQRGEAFTADKHCEQLTTLTAVVQKKSVALTQLEKNNLPQ